MHDISDVAVLLCATLDVLLGNWTEALIKHVDDIKPGASAAYDLFTLPQPDP